MKRVFVLPLVFLLSGCAVFGVNGVESAPYTLLTADEGARVEVRTYESLVLVSASMQSNAFRRLFGYISGNNKGAKEIAMTAPVFMQNQAKGMEIAMTAPVLMSAGEGGGIMSFVMPSKFTLETTPEPLDPTLVVSEVKGYTAAAIQFSGTINERSVVKHTKELQKWIAQNNYMALSEPVTAGYDSPFTIPSMRRNEVLIAVAKRVD
ncbi:heme-binding protein [Pseudoalteromonas sp. YIC-656]|uniref:SOUL family heme-binding protein n=1 Tax=Pseudoalteromonas pernae TaxID=3118054 RepID=UPI003241BDFF